MHERTIIVRVRRLVVSQEERFCLYRLSTNASPEEIKLLEETFRALRPRQAGEYQSQLLEQARRDWRMTHFLRKLNPKDATHFQTLWEAYVAQQPKERPREIDVASIAYYLGIGNSPLLSFAEYIRQEGYELSSDEQLAVEQQPMTAAEKDQRIAELLAEGAVVIECPREHPFILRYPEGATVAPDKSTAKHQTLEPAA